MGELAEDFAYMKEQRQKHKDAVTPNRMEYAARLLRDAGHTVDNGEPGQIIINGYITLWAFTGWWSGKGIGSGRGIKNLVFKLQQETIDKT